MQRYLQVIFILFNKKYFKINKDFIILTLAVDSNLPVTAVPVIDLTRIELNDGYVVGGRVLDLQWSPKGHHLAITFRDSTVIAIFNISMQHTLQISPW